MVVCTGLSFAVCTLRGFVWVFPICVYGVAWGLWSGRDLGFVGFCRFCGWWGLLRV